MADLYVAPSQRSFNLSWLRLIFDGWVLPGRCCYSSEFSSRIFGPCYSLNMSIFLLRTGLLLRFLGSSFGAGGFSVDSDLDI